MYFMRQDKRMPFGALSLRDVQTVSAGDTRRAGSYYGLSGVILPSYASRTLMLDSYQSIPEAWICFTDLNESSGRTIYKSVSSKNFSDCIPQPVRSQDVGWLTQPIMASCRDCALARLWKSAPAGHADFGKSKKAPQQKEINCGASGVLGRDKIS